MKAIILSAGQGRRLLPMTKHLPKCALTVADQTVLEWQLHELATCDVDEVVVVTGFGADAVDPITARIHDIKVRTFHNPFFAACDNLGTCWIARGEMDGPFMIINGDTLFESAIPRRLLAHDSGFPITLAADHKSSYDDDDMKIIAADGQLLSVGKQLDRQNVNAESIGMMVFRGNGPDLFRHKLDYLIRYHKDTSQWYLSAIDALAQRGHIGICPIDGLSWCEIDDPEDLQAADRIVRSWYQSAATG